MSLRTIMIFPEFENMYVIDPIRNRYDPLAKLVRPHITIVFPFESDMSNDELSYVLDMRLASVEPFDIELSGFTKHSGPDGNYIFLNMTRGAKEIKKIHDELYNNEFSLFDKGFEYVPHITVGKLETEAKLEDAFNTVKYKRDVFSCNVNKISVEMIGEHEESIIILEKELTKNEPVPVAVPFTVNNSIPEDKEMDADYAEILNTMKGGDYNRALSLLKKADSSQNIACHNLLLLLCAYKVSSTEELLEKACSNIILTKHLLTRTDMKRLTSVLYYTDNNLDVYMAEYCLLSLRRSNLSAGEMYEFFKTETRITTSSNYKSSFAKMDEEDEHNYLRNMALENAANPYELDFFEELNDNRMQIRMTRTPESLIMLICTTTELISRRSRSRRMRIPTMAEIR